MQDAEVTTVEGLASEGRLHPLQQSFVDHGAFQCGYYTPGQICSALGMLAEAGAGWRSCWWVEGGGVARDYARAFGG